MPKAKAALAKVLLGLAKETESEWQQAILKAEEEVQNYKALIKKASSFTNLSIDIKTHKKYLQTFNDHLKSDPMGVINESPKHRKLLDEKLQKEKWERTASRMKINSYLIAIRKAEAEETFPSKWEWINSVREACRQLEVIQEKAAEGEASFIEMIIQEKFKRIMNENNLSGIDQLELYLYNQYEKDKETHIKKAIENISLL